MNLRSLILLCLALCLGCTDAADRRAEQERREAVAKNLKVIGQTTRSHRTEESSLDESGEAQESSTESTGATSDESIKPQLLPDNASGNDVIPQSAE